MTFAHITVLLRETVDLLDVQQDGLYLDLTLGGGGHSEEILRRGGRVVGVDRDERALTAARLRLASYGDRFQAIHGRFGEASSLVDSQFDGALADIGVSSPQVDDAGRGFSFREGGPLDMRMDTSSGETAQEMISRLSEEELANVIYQFGEERKSRPIAREIKKASEAGAMTTTADLRAAVHRIIRPTVHLRIDPATKTFQALRIAVNGELSELESLLKSATKLVKLGGALSVISFHSLEDRMVKHTFRENPNFEPLTKKPVTASDEELAANPRSRSAKLRAARIVEPVIKTDPWGRPR